MAAGSAGASGTEARSSTAPSASGRDGSHVASPSGRVAEDYGGGGFVSYETAAVRAVRQVEALGDRACVDLAGLMRVSRETSSLT